MKKKYTGKYDLKELEERKKQNAKENLEFIDWYADWVKKTPNRIWSKVHKEFMDS